MDCRHFLDQGKAAQKKEPRSKELRDFNRGVKSDAKYMESDACPRATVVECILSDSQVFQKNKKKCVCQKRKYHPSMLAVEGTV